MDTLIEFEMLIEQRLRLFVEETLVEVNLAHSTEMSQNDYEFNSRVIYTKGKFNIHAFFSVEDEDCPNIPTVYVLELDVRGVKDLELARIEMTDPFTLDTEFDDNKTYLVKNASRYFPFTICTGCNNHFVVKNDRCYDCLFSDVLEDCSICRETNFVGLVFETSCNHKFHFKCFKQYHDTVRRERHEKVRCPLCRAAQHM